MEDVRAQQVEALQVAEDYSKKIIVALKNIIEEYSGNEKSDTEEYEQHIVKGLNWIIQVYNGTKSLLLEDGSTINKDLVNQSVIKLNEAINNNDNLMRVEAYKGILAFVEEFHKEASKY